MPLRDSCHHITLLRREAGEVFGKLVPEAENPRPLDFFGSWSRLKGSRDERFKRMLDSIAKG